MTRRCCLSIALFSLFVAFASSGFSQNASTSLRGTIKDPSGAVVPTGSKYIVFVDRGGGKLEPREVEIGVHAGDYYEVLSGLNEGDRVVSSANFLIDAESRIQGVLKTWGDRP